MVDWLNVVHNWCCVVNRVDHRVVNWVHDGGMVDWVRNSWVVEC